MTDKLTQIVKWISGDCRLMFIVEDNSFSEVFIGKTLRTTVSQQWDVVKSNCC